MAGPIDLSCSTNLMAKPRRSNLMEKPSEERDWSSDLPADLMGSILRHLPLPDYLRFRAVCRAWCVAAADNPYSLAVNPPSPWLTITHENDESSTATTRTFYSISERRFYTLHLPQLLGLRCIGSSNGWLVTLDRAAELHLVNPITGARLSLPSLTTFSDIEGPRYDVDGTIIGYRAAAGHQSQLLPMGAMGTYYAKVAVLSIGLDVTVFVIHKPHFSLAYARPGRDESWIELENPYHGGFEDIALHKGKLYGILHEGCKLVVVADLSTSFPITTNVSTLSGPAPLPGGGRGNHWWSRFYLVESTDGRDLLLVWRYEWKAGFRVFRLEKGEWVKIEELGRDCAIFLGTGLLMSLSTKDLPQLRGNCIYFSTELCLHLPSYLPSHDAGVFHLGDSTYTPFCQIQDRMPHFVPLTPTL